MTCARQIYSTLGNPPRCGRCLDYAQAVIAEAQRDAPAPIDALAAATI